jgi:AraC-like DNA-binding protein
MPRMATVPVHRCRILPSPWPGLHAVETCSGRHYGRHSHGTYGFGFVDEGAHRSSSDRRSFDAYAGDIVATNPGEMHDGRPLGGPVRRWHTVYVEPQLLASAAGLRAAGEVRITRAAFRDPDLRVALGHLVTRLDEPARDALACEEALVRACALLVARHTTEAAPAHAAIGMHRTRERLLADMAQPPSLAQLAAEAGVSRFQLLRRFAQVHGCTPHAFLVQQRAERARALIASGVELADAAASCGFADQAHMTRLFTRQFGFTPGAWQRAHGALQ